jgi:molybdopterin-guanine dinucleotide biosynthesis protein B
MLWPTCPSVVALATDGEVDCPVPVLDLAAPAAVADLVVGHLGITARPR